MWSTAATSSTPSLAGPISATPSSWIFVGRMDFPANKGSGSDAASLITGSGAFKNVPRSIFGFARDDSDDSGGRAMTQVKNSLGRDDLASLSYRIDSTQITTRKGIATTGKFVFLGESERSVADVLRDSRSSLDEYELADRSDAESWLDKYLLDNGGTAEAKTVIAAGEASGYNAKTIKNVRTKVARHKREGFGKGSKLYWIHRSSAIDPDIGPIDPEDRKPGPMGPVEGPMGESPRRLYLVGKGRCPDCDYHIPTQGHRDNCPANTARVTSC
jgi:hypothetical protein